MNTRNFHDSDVNFQHNCVTFRHQISYQLHAQQPSSVTSNYQFASYFHPRVLYDHRTRQIKYLSRKYSKSCHFYLRQVLCLWNIYRNWNILTQNRMYLALYKAFTLQNRRFDHTFDRFWERSFGQLCGVTLALQ